MKQMLRLFVVAGIALSFSMQSFAAPKAYFDQELSGWSKPHLVVGDQSYDMGQWVPYYGIEGLFEEGTAAEEYALLHVTHARRAAWGIWGGIGLYAAGTIAADRDSDSYDQVMLGSALALFVGVLYGSYQANLSRAYLYKAINEYNEVETASEEGDLSMNATPLSWTFSF